MSPREDLVRDCKGAVGKMQKASISTNISLLNWLDNPRSGSLDNVSGGLAGFVRPAAPGSRYGDIGIYPADHAASAALLLRRRNEPFRWPAGAGTGRPGRPFDPPAMLGSS